MIRKTAIVGMGALGLLFGQKIAEKMGSDNLYFIMDEARKERHLKDTYIINGQKYSFHICSPDDISEPVDLIIIATKYNGLYEARDLIRPLVGEQTIIVSYNDFKDTFVVNVSEADETELYGDLDGNGKVDVTDLTELSLYLVGDRELDQYQLDMADMNYDGKTDIVDLATLKQKIAKK